MRIKSHEKLFYKTYKQIIIILTILFCLISAKSYAFADKETSIKIFSLGRSAGASYYHLTNLCDKSMSKSYSVIKKEYDDAFQNLNLMDIILDDFKISADSRQQLNNLIINLYNSLKDQDLKEASLFNTRDAYIFYYENLSKNIKEKFSSEGSWLFTLGFYSSFQLEAINSTYKSKLLLSGFNKIISSNPFSCLPEPILNQLKTINNLDKTDINDKELECLKQSFIKIIGYFENHKENKPLTNNIKPIIGTWQGTIIDPENQKHTIKLTVTDNLNIKMDIDGIAQNIMISDAKIINNYFTFMFKPFGNEKLYIRFNAKINNNTLAGEVIDVLGQKGNWLLSKT